MFTECLQEDDDQAAVFNQIMQSIPDSLAAIRKMATVSTKIKMWEQKASSHARVVEVHQTTLSPQKLNRPGASPAASPLKTPAAPYRRG
jgi:hypothetical protein